MSRRKCVVLIGVTVILLLLAGTVFLLPVIVKKQAIQWVATHTERTLDIDRISINPFTLTLEMQGFSLSEATEPIPFLAFERLHVEFSVRSLLERGPIVKNLHLDRPVMRLVRTAANSYNFADLLALGGNEDPASTAEPMHFSINNITFDNGALDFLDQAVVPSVHHRVDELHLAIPFIGNVAYLVDEYVTPLLRARFNDSPFVFAGKLKPFADSVEASVDINVDNLDLPEYVSYLPAELPVRIRTGHFSMMLGISYRVATEAGPQLSLSGDLVLTGLTVTESDGKPLCFLPMAKVTLAEAKPLSDRIALDQILVYGLEMILSRDRQGNWNFNRLTNPTVNRVDPGEKEAASASNTPLVSIGNIRLRGGRLQFQDDFPEGGFTSRFNEISLDLQDLSTGGGRQSSFALSFESDRAERASLAGSFTLQPFASAGSFEATGIPLEAYSPYLASTLTRPIDGLVSVDGDLSLDAAGGLLLTNGAVTIRGLRLPFGSGDGLQLERFSLSDITVDSRERRAVVGLFEIENGELRFSRDATGELSPLSLLQPPPATETPSPANAPPMAWQIAKATTTNLAVTFIDGSLAARPTHSLRNVAFSIANLRSTGPSFESLTASAAYGKGGQMQLTVAGQVEPLDISGKLRLKRLPLPGVNPYLPDHIRLEMVSAELDAGLDFHLKKHLDQTAGSITGNLGVRDFYAIETVSGDDLMLWESLQFDRVHAELSPFSLHIGNIALNDFQTRLIINPDGSINLKRILSKADDTSPADVATEKKTSDKPAEIVIDAITLQNGLLDFTDRNMRPVYQVKMYNLGGHIGKMSSLGGHPAEVDLRGNLRNESPLSIRGTIDPLTADLYLDLKIRFSDIELSPASPYAGRYLGYLVEKGKLFLDLEYHVEKHRLESRNRIFLDQFTFGERIESEDAINLPVRLAVALLKDRKGEIHLDLPVRGRTDDPQFSIWGLVWQVFKNLLSKAATSPIALLTSMFGGGEEFSSIAFPFGSTRLLEAEQEKLGKLAAAINDRPALKLEIMGFVDRGHDPEAYRNEVLQQKMRKEKHLELIQRNEAAPGAPVDSVVLTPEDESKYLEAIYKKADFAKPRNFLGLVKTIPESEMRKLILSSIPAGEEEMTALAWGRAAAVRSYLVGTGSVPAERIFHKRVDIYQEKEGTGGNRVEFGVTAP